MTPCFDLTDEITNQIADPEVQARLRATVGDRPMGAIEVIRKALEPDTRDIFEAEMRGLPASIVRTLGELAITAADHGVPFAFQSVPPENLMETARAPR